MELPNSPLLKARYGQFINARLLRPSCLLFFIAKAKSDKDLRCLGQALNSTLDPLTGISSFLIVGKRSCTPTTEVTVLGNKLKIDFDVIQPNGETAKKIADRSFTPGTQGVGMSLEVTTQPTDVSFSNVEVIEIDQRTQNVTGFFQLFPSNSLTHMPNPEWVQLGEKNQWFDSAAFYGWGDSTTWANGTYQWAIEVRWRVAGQESGQGEVLGNRTQTHTMHDNTGKSTEDKMNNSATRTP